MGRRPLVDPADAAHEIEARSIGQPQVQDDEIDAIEIGANTREELNRAANDDGAMPRLFEGRLKTVAHEAGVVGDKDGLDDHRRPGHRFVISDGSMSDQ